MMLGGCMRPVSAPPPEALPAPARVSIPEHWPEELPPVSEIRELTRSGLAVLLVRELPIGGMPVSENFPVVVDIAEHWARREILTAVQRQLIPVPPNHRFEPDRPITRGEAAEVLTGILERMNVNREGLPSSGRAPTDLPHGHRYYRAVRMVLAAGIMHLDASGRFHVSQPVSGKEMEASVNKINRLLSSYP
jgi:hypothetical protein